jgi:hypothetical protein
MRRMKVVALSVDPLSNLPLVLLADDDGALHLPVPVGTGEAAAIAVELDQIELERPMTHQLACALLASTGAQVVRVELDLDDRGAIVARVLLRQPGGGELHKTCARASDALAFALRTHAEIVASDRALAQAAADAADGVDLDPATLPVVAGATEPEGELLAGLAGGAFGQW